MLESGALDLWCTAPASSKEAERMLALLEKYGYRSVCWCKESSTRLDNNTHRVRTVPPSGENLQVTQLMRMNMHVEEETHVASIHASRDVLNQYDVVAVIPHSEAALEKCLQSPAVEHIDIISLPSGQRWPFPLKSAVVRKAIQSGLHFELCYSAALRDGLSRRYLVSNLQALIELLLPEQRRSAKGLLISSGADECRLFRSPQDITNLLCLFGCHEIAAEQIVMKNPHMVLQHVAKRRMPPIIAAPPKLLTDDAETIRGALGKRHRCEDG